MICFIFQSYITSVDMILTFTNKYVRNGYRHFLGKVQVFYKNFELLIVRPELQYYLFRQLLHFLTQIKFYDYFYKLFPSKSSKRRNQVD